MAGFSDVPNVAGPTMIGMIGLPTEKTWLHCIAGVIDTLYWIMATTSGKDIVESKPTRRQTPGLLVDTLVGSHHASPHPFLLPWCSWPILAPKVLRHDDFFDYTYTD